MNITLKEWNKSLKYAREACGRLNENGHDVEITTYTMYDSDKGIQFIVRDCEGNVFTTMYTGTKHSFEEMRSAIEYIVGRLSTM